MEDIDLQRLAESGIMADLPLPTTAQRKGSLLEVTPDVACLQQSIVNLYFIGDPHSAEPAWVLVDAGMPLGMGSIVEAAEERFGPGTRPLAIVLTHGHFDHVGALLELADHWDVPVYAHELEHPYLNGGSSYPPPDPLVGGGAMAYLASMYPRGPIDVSHRLHALPFDGTVPNMPAWQWIHTPGHTPGHISLFRRADRTLIAGDAFVTTRQESALAVLTRWQEVWRPPAYYTCDWNAARRSVETLAQLQPNVAATGHGIPMYGEALQRGLERLVRDWDRLAPSFGRYVGRPAIADRQGVVALPPPVVSNRTLALAAFGAGVVVGAAFWALNTGRSHKITT